MAVSKPPSATSSPPARAELPRSTRVRFRDGDVDALAEVYDRYARPVWSVAMTVTHADHLAQEAVQEAFLRAWNAAPTYDPDRDLGPWMLTIARYTALDLLRRELRPTRGGHEAEQDNDAVVDPPDLDRAWISWAVQEALRQLSDHEREIVRLSFYEDLTHAQISEQLGLPVGTVKSRSHRAHRRLAELLEHVRDVPEFPPDGNPSGSGSRTHTGTAPRQRRDDA
ncbi:sigma-70 family RNA polymerase sigma factor [Actinoplanes sp. NPDC051861]|uniref:RNA polymerase sigma factor n=1 Tax=Actinoplanes sp. NPDC051861 TaxID=3155170 RepID=UPI0034417E9B